MVPLLDFGGDKKKIPHWSLLMYEVQARAPRGDPPRKQDFLRIFLIEKNLLAGKLWMNMFLIRTHTCIVRKVFCLERII